MTDDNIIGRRIKEMRARKNLSQKEAAERLGVGGSRYSNWENSHRTPPREIIMKMAELFDTTGAYLAGYSEHPGAEPLALDFISVCQNTISVNDVIIALETANSAALHVDYIKKRGLNENKLTSTIAPDNAMAPIIKEGDELLVDRTKNQITDADIFAFYTRGRLWVRWIRPEITGKICIAAEDKQHFPDQFFDADEFKAGGINIIGRVTRISTDR